MAQVVRKAQPNSNQTHIDKPLTEISIAYMQDSEEFIADKVFPRVPVDKRSDKYFIYNKNDWLRDEAEKRAPSTPSTGSGYNLSDDSYYADVWAFHKDISEQERANTDEPLDAEADATEFVTQKLLLKREREFLDKFVKASVWDSSATGGEDGDSPDFVYFSDYSNSEPIREITSRKREIKIKTGKMPNTLLIAGQVWDELRTHPAIIDLVKYTQSGVNIGKDLVASALGVDTLVVAEGIMATNDEGDSEETYEELISKDGLLLYVAENPGLRRPSAGYIFPWRGYGGANAYGATVSQFYMDQLKADRIEGELAFDMKVTGSDLAIFLEDMVE